MSLRDFDVSTCANGDHSAHRCLIAACNKWKERKIRRIYGKMAWTQSSDRLMERMEHKINQNREKHDQYNLEEWFSSSSKRREPANNQSKIKCSNYDNPNHIIWDFY